MRAEEINSDFFGYLGKYEELGGSGVSKVETQDARR